VRSNGIYAAELVSPVAIFSGGNLRDASLQTQLLKGLTTGGLLKLKSVRMDAHEAGETCVVHTREVCLSLAEAKWDCRTGGSGGCRRKRDVNRKIFVVERVFADRLIPIWVTIYAPPGN